MITIKGLSLGGAALAITGGVAGYTSFFWSYWHVTDYGTTTASPGAMSEWCSTSLGMVAQQLGAVGNACGSANDIADMADFLIFFGLFLLGWALVKIVRRKP